MVVTARYQQTMGEEVVLKSRRMTYESDIVREYRLPVGSKVFVKYFIYENGLRDIIHQRTRRSFNGEIVKDYGRYFVVKRTGNSGCYNETILKKDLYIGRCGVSLVEHHD